MEREGQEQECKNVWVMPGDFLESKDGHKYKAEIDAFWKRQDLLLVEEGH